MCQASIYTNSFVCMYSDMFPAQIVLGIGFAIWIFVEKVSEMAFLGG